MPEGIGRARPIPSAHSAVRHDSLVLSWQWINSVANRVSPFAVPSSGFTARGNYPRTRSRTTLDALRPCNVPWRLHYPPAHS